MFDAKYLERDNDRSYHSAEIPIGRRAEATAFEQKLIAEDYTSFYQRGGWVYDENIEGAWLLHRLLRPLGLRPGSSLLELGCGTGFHAGLLSKLGLRVTAVDICDAAIAQAKAIQGPVFMCIDAAQYLGGTNDMFDVIYARGMSWFHYELEPGLNRNGINVHAAMGTIIKRIQPGGLFVLQIRTDFSGSIDVTGVRNHAISQLSDFLTAFGEIVLLNDWSGNPVYTPNHKDTLCGVVAAIRVASPITRSHQLPG